MTQRCTWTGDDPAMIDYHDHEWGRPVHDERHLFEMLTLEGAQAGLTWRTILHKRQGYRIAFADWDIEKIARFTPARIEKLLANPDIVRNRLKVHSTVTNAKAALAIIKQHGSLDAYLWQLAGGKTTINRFRTMADLPARTDVSDAMSKQLKRDGFRFVGSTICYAFMQATGMVNDHLLTCPAHAPCTRLSQT